MTSKRMLKLIEDAFDASKQEVEEREESTHDLSVLVQRIGDIFEQAYKNFDKQKFLRKCGW